MPEYSINSIKILKKMVLKKFDEKIIIVSHSQRISISH